MKMMWLSMADLCYSCYLDECVVPYGVYVPVVAQPKQGGEQATEQHATRQVIA